MTTSELKIYQGRMCCLPPMPVREFPEGVSDDRQRLIVILGRFWVSGTKLTYVFMGGSDDQQQIVRSSFDYWHRYATPGISFREVHSGDAIIRIGFVQGDGTWSYLGRDILTVPRDQRTMNYGWKLIPDRNGIDDDALHEIGHTLGFPHEHQNPKAGIVWNEEFVYKIMAGPPNCWTKEQTYNNILSKIPIDSVKGTNWDVDSIMHYQFEAGMIQVPEKYKTQPLIPAGGLSPSDLKLSNSLYPLFKAAEEIKNVLSANQPISLEMKQGKQQEFMIENPESGYYTIETLGNVDTVLALFKKPDTLLKLDDNGGYGRNARIVYELDTNEDYIIRLRLLYQYRQPAPNEPFMQLLMTPGKKELERED